MQTATSLQFPVRRLEFCGAEVRQKHHYVSAFNTYGPSKERPLHIKRYDRLHNTNNTQYTEGTLYLIYPEVSNSEHSSMNTQVEAVPPSVQAGC